MAMDMPRPPLGKFDRTMGLFIPNSVGLDDMGGEIPM
jgi:hypothetical protein